MVQRMSADALRFASQQVASDEMFFRNVISVASCLIKWFHAAETTQQYFCSITRLPLGGRSSLWSCAARHLLLGYFGWLARDVGGAQPCCSLVAFSCEYRRDGVLLSRL